MNAPRIAKRMPNLKADARKLIKEQSTALFRALCRRSGVPEPVTEYHFAKPERVWRFDFAWLDAKVALEVEGGIWTQGRHTRGAGFLGDIAKYNRATELGWSVFRTTPSELDTISTLTMISRAIKGRTA